MLGDRECYRTRKQHQVLSLHNTGTRTPSIHIEPRHHRRLLAAREQPGSYR